MDWFELLKSSTHSAPRSSPGGLTSTSLITRPFFVGSWYLRSSPASMEAFTPRTGSGMLERASPIPGMELRANPIWLYSSRSGTTTSMSASPTEAPMVRRCLLAFMKGSIFPERSHPSPSRPNDPVTVTFLAFSSPLHFRDTPAVACIPNRGPLSVAETTVLVFPSMDRPSAETSSV